MEVRELRAGVLVYRCGEIVICNPEYILECESYPDKFEPIPLTEEWLLKFGFIKEDFHDLGIFLHLDISDSIGLNINQNTIWMGEYNTGVKYVHQLQNLYFALTGKELSLKDENTF